MTGDGLVRTFERTGCPAPTDGGLVRADLERIVAAIATALRPTTAVSTCAARKLKATGRLAVATARAFAREAPRPADRLAELDPIVYALLADFRVAFARLEAQGGCLTTSDADPIWSKGAGRRVRLPPRRHAARRPRRHRRTLRWPGNGIVEQPEQCEGTVCYDGGNPIPGCRPDSCTCCGYPCYYFGCCDPEETCMPSPSTGYCFKFTCNQSPTCNYGFQCIDSPDPILPGKICAGEPGTTCFLPDFSGGITLACVPPGTCQNGTCCSPAGEACSESRTCCSAVCSGGTCN